MTKEDYEKVKDLADYAAIEGIKEGHAPGQLLSLHQLVLQPGRDDYQEVHAQQAGI